MIEQTLSLLGAMYDALGPGLLLAAAFPVFLVAFAWWARTVFVRARTHR
jgi:hypothetical protein